MRSTVSLQKSNDCLSLCSFEEKNKKKAKISKGNSWKRTEIRRIKEEKRRKERGKKVVDYYESKRNSNNESC